MKVKADRFRRWLRVEIWDIPMSEWLLAWLAGPPLFWAVGLRFGWYVAAMVGNAVFIAWFVLRRKLG